MTSTVLLSISDQIYQALSKKILGGELPPGTRLTEVKLSSEFNTSRLPIREALQRLANDGLVETAPRKGAAVARLDQRRASEIIDATGALVALAAKQAAQCISDQELEAMRRKLNEVRAAIEAGQCKGYPHDIYDMDEHLISVSGNQTVGGILRGLKMKIELIRTYSPSRHSQTWLIQVWDEHWAIYQALAARDVDNAAAEVAKHFDGVKKRLIAGMDYRSQRKHPREA